MHENSEQTKEKRVDTLCSIIKDKRPNINSTITLIINAETKKTEKTLCGYLTVVDGINAGYYCKLKQEDERGFFGVPYSSRCRCPFPYC